MNSSSAPGKYEGKTFSLFGEDETTEGYYSIIRKLTEDLLKEESDLKTLIKKLRFEAENESGLKKQLRRRTTEFPEYTSRLYPNLSHYTKNVTGHLQDLSLYKKLWDKRLATTEAQYHLYMIIIELVNRLYKDEFRKCHYKIALLPHCLRDFSKECKSAPDDFDYECKGCSKDCFINKVSKLLREQNIHPYIWKDADLKKLFKDHRDNGQTLGVMGIACIPELENGMQKCMKARVPVIGILLDANRCGRWFGEFYPNTITLSEIEKLIGIEAL